MRGVGAWVFEQREDLVDLPAEGVEFGDLFALFRLSSWGVFLLACFPAEGFVGCGDYAVLEEGFSFGYFRLVGYGRVGAVLDFTGDYVAELFPLFRGGGFGVPGGWLGSGVWFSGGAVSHAEVQGYVDRPVIRRVSEVVNSCVNDSVADVVRDQCYVYEPSGYAVLADGFSGPEVWLDWS